MINLSNLSYIDRDFQNIISLLKDYNLKYPENERIILILADLCFSAGFVRDTIYFHKRLIDHGNFNMKDLAALIFLLNYSSEYSEDEYKKYCKIYDDKLLENKIEYDILNNEHDKKKIGFLSYDLREHSVGYFLRDFIKNLKNKNYKPVAFNLFKGDIAFKLRRYMHSKNIFPQIINWLVRITFSKVLFTYFSTVCNKILKTNFYFILIVFFILIINARMNII